jgi:thiol:disulfide interchange protein DsbC
MLPDFPQPLLVKKMPSALQYGLVRAFGCLIALLLCTAAFADEEAIRKVFKEKFPELTVEKVTKTPYSNLYEVFAQDQIVYTDEKASFLMMGRLVDIKSGQDVTAERRGDLTRVNFGDLPLNLAMKIVKGNGKRKVAVFSDPDCPYCKRLEKDMAKVTDVTIYMFLYPIDSLHPNAAEKARAVWCSADQVKSWNELMLNGVVPKESKCDDPIDKIAAVGEKYRITGTPTLIFPNGRKVPGAIPAEEMEKMLNAAAK